MFKQATTNLETFCQLPGMSKGSSVHTPFSFLQITANPCIPVVGCGWEIILHSGLVFEGKLFLLGRAYNTVTRADFWDMINGWE